jgi:hypothetical protein
MLQPENATKTACEPRPSAYIPDDIGHLFLIIIDIFLYAFLAGLYMVQIF